MKFFVFPFTGPSAAVLLLFLIPKSKELECYECNYSQTPPNNSLHEHHANENCLDPVKFHLEPKVCKGDQKCVKGSYMNSVTGKEMYRRCEPSFETGCKDLPNTNTNSTHSRHRRRRRRHQSQINPDHENENPEDQIVIFTKEYICVCNKERCNSEPGLDIQRQNFSDITEYSRRRNGGSSVTIPTMKIKIKNILKYLSILLVFYIIHH